MLARLMQDDAGKVQRGSVCRIGLNDCVVAQKSFAQLPLLVQAKRTVELGGDGHLDDGYGKAKV
ncbi:MAG TPA: hypothetical protein VEO36_13680 [Casimicrobiaceae bacterium]|nr:hypothetical protein [Casimicrobiaceae bacterium]